MKMTYYRLKLLIGNNPYLFSAYKKYFDQDYKDKKHKADLIHGKSDLCLGGYGGSANGFTYNLLKVINPNTNVAHHCHKAALVKIALMNDIPATINIRHPKEAISSVIRRFDNRQPKKELLHYFNFYRELKDLLGQVLIIPFEEITQHPEISVDRISDFSGFSLSYKNINSKVKEAKDSIKAYRRSNGSPQGFETSDAERSRQKKKIKNGIITLDKYKEAKEVYSYYQNKVN